MGQFDGLPQKKVEGVAEISDEEANKYAKEILAKAGGSVDEAMKLVEEANKNPVINEGQIKEFEDISANETSAATELKKLQDEYFRSDERLNTLMVGAGLSGASVLSGASLLALVVGGTEGAALVTASPIIAALLYNLKLRVSFIRQQHQLRRRVAMEGGN